MACSTVPPSRLDRGGVRLAVAVAGVNMVVVLGCEDVDTNGARQHGRVAPSFHGRFALIGSLLVSFCF